MNTNNQSPENKRIIGLNTTVETCFRPGCGKDSEKSKAFSIEQIVAGNVLQNDCYHMAIAERTETEIKGSIYWIEPASFGHSSRLLTFDCGEFTLSEKKPTHSTEFLNCAYDTHMRIYMALQLSDI